MYQYMYHEDIYVGFEAVFDFTRHLSGNHVTKSNTNVVKQSTTPEPIKQAAKKKASKQEHDQINKHTIQKKQTSETYGKTVQ